MHNDYYVYLHRRKDTNEVFYVGKGKGDRIKSRKNRNVWWRRIVDKVGCDFEFVERGLSECDAFDLEIELIKFYRDNGHSICNLTDGGEGTSGRLQTECAKLKISAARKGQPISAEHRAKLSAANKGIPKQMSDDHKKSLAEAHKSKRKRVYCSNGMTFDYAGDALVWIKNNNSKIKSTSPSSICACCRGRLLAAFGYVWSYTPLDECDRTINPDEY